MTAVASLTIKTLWANKRRLIGTLLAITLGIAFLSGTRLLGDTLSANFDRLFAQANGATDVVVRSGTKISSDQRQNTRGAISASLLNSVKGTPGVADAEPYIEGYGQLLGRDRKVIGNGPPTRAGNWLTERSLNPYRLVAGRAPRADDEVVINRGAADTGHLHLGDTTTLLTPRPQQVRIVGIATFGTADGFGPSTFTGLTLHAAQQDLTNTPAQLTEILVKAAPGVSANALAGRLGGVLPTGVQTITGAQLAAENVNQINSGFLSFVRTGLLVFAIIALLVAAFSIHNTFSVLAAQRSRDTALLRAIGATRRQVLTATTAETLAVGLLGSGLGWVVGIGIAGLLKAVFAGFGSALPTGGLVVRPSSVVIAVVAGLVATLVGGLGPALRAARLAPLAALRHVAVEEVAPSSRRIIIGGALTAVGVITVVLGASGVVTVGVAALGAVLTIAGIVALGPVTAGPVAAILGAPGAALRGVTGDLARQNAMRNPRRTSATAAALMVGVSVVTLFTVIGASLKASAARGVDRSLTADLVVNSAGIGGAYGGGRFSPQLAVDIATTPAVRVAAGMGAGSALLDGASHPVVIVDPTSIGQVVDLGVTAGTLDALGPHTLAVATTVAKAHHWTLGTAVGVTYPDGATDRLTVVAIYQHADITGSYLLAPATWAAHDPQPVDEQILIALQPGSNTRSAKTAISAVAARYGNPKVLDRAQYRRTAAGAVNTILAFVYVMLALAIIIALLGIANTLSLSVHERTRELGLLRAVGQTRRQIRSMVRWESAIIAVFGTIGGVLVGTFLGWAVVKASASATLAVFSVPPAQLAVFLAVGAVAGVLAGIRPARRAARLNVLAAIAAE
jgi:putative ABC transport system permease protein